MLIVNILINRLGPKMRAKVTMNKMSYYIIQYCNDCESIHQTILYGKKQDDWEMYCSSFMQEAINNIIDKYDGYIGVGAITNEIINILVTTQKYKIIELPKYGLYGSCIITEDEKYNEDNLFAEYPEVDFSKVFKHNQNIGSQ
jgi:hypothetical protein